MRRLLFATIILSLTPESVWAAGCDCGTIRGIVNTSQKQIIQSVNTHTTSEASSIKSDIKIAAQNIIGTIKTESASIVRAILDLKESNIATAKEYSAVDQAVKTQDMYGKAAQPSGLCDSTGMSAGVQVGFQANKLVYKGMRSKQQEYSRNPNAKPYDFLARITHAEHPNEEQMMESMWPIEQTLTQEQVGHAQETIKTLTNPRPLPVVTEEQAATLSGEAYKAVRLVHDGRISVATQAINEHVTYHSPSLADDVTKWATDQWKKLGNNGTPPGVVEGKLSQAGLFSLLSQMRLGSPNWVNQLSELNEHGLLRELVFMQAVQLELTRKNNEFLDQLTFISSIDYLSRMEGSTSKEVEEQYIKMVGAQQ